MNPFIPRKRESRRIFLKKSGLTIGGFGLVSSGFSEGLVSGSEQTLDNMVKDVQPIIREDYLSRQEQARKLMAEQGIAGLFLSGGTNMVYFTGTSWWLSERIFSVILPLKGEPVWICPAFEEERAREVVLFGKDIRLWQEHESPYALIKQACIDLGIRGKKLGISPDVRNFEVEGLTRELKGSGITLTNGAGISEGCRVIKTQKEIGYMDLANRITKLAYKEGFSKLFEGMSPNDLASVVSKATGEMGVSGGGWPQFGPNTAFPHGSKAVHNLQPGDNVLIDGGCSVEGFDSDVTRTIVFGTPTDRQRKVFDVVLAAQQKARDAVRPGVTCESIDYAARKYMEEQGFGPDYKYFAHRLGHGIGMDGHEYTYLVRGNKTLLRPGMTFSNEPGIYIYGEFGVRVEDCFVVTENGCHMLGGMESSSIEKPFGEL